MRKLLFVVTTAIILFASCTKGGDTPAPGNAKGDFVVEGAQVEIGGDDRYIAVCRKCWRNKRIEQSSRGALPFPELNVNN